MAAQEKAQASSSVNQEVDLDELMDVSWFAQLYLMVHYFTNISISCRGAFTVQDPELEKLHADRIAALKVGVLGFDILPLLHIYIKFFWRFLCLVLTLGFI